MFEFSTPESLLDVDFSKPVFVLVDRLAIPGGAPPDARQRIVDTVEICYRESGEAIFEPAGGGDSLRFNEKFQCKLCGKEFLEPEPSLFSFNNPYGACKRCQGFGNTIDYDLDLVIPDKSLSVAGRRGGSVDQAAAFLVSRRGIQAAARGKFRLNVPFFELTAAERALLADHIRRYFHEVEKKKYKVHVRVFLSRYRGYTHCPDCGGSRLRPEALYIRVGEKNLADVVKMNIAEAQAFFNGLQLSPEETQIAEKILVEIQQRLKFLNDVGLEYLTLDRFRRRCRAGKRSASNWRRASVRGWWARATCSTNRPSDCIAATPAG